MKHRNLAVILLMTACSADTADRMLGCGTDDALAACLGPTQTPEYYADVSSKYFDTMDYRYDVDPPMPYSEHVVRWEWPPWLLLTAFGAEQIEAADTILTLYPSIVEERRCQGFDVQPFGRCRVVFYYDDHGGKSCPIYEEFTFNDAGEVTFIEAWTDQPGYLPMAVDDSWAEGPSVTRMSTRVPGLGTPTGRIALGTEAMQRAMAADSDLADMITRTDDWLAAWTDLLLATDRDAMWAEGCGWN